MACSVFANGRGVVHQQSGGMSPVEAVRYRLELLREFSGDAAGA